MKLSVKAIDAIFYDDENNPIFYLDNTVASLDCIFNISNEEGEKLIEIGKRRMLEHENKII